MVLTYLANIGRYIPELLCVLTMIGLLFIESTYDESEQKRPLFYSAAFTGLLVALFTLMSMVGDDPTSIFTGAVVIDPFSTVIKMIMILGTIGTIYLSKESRDVYGHMKSEYSIMAVGVLVGGMILTSANNMLMMHIGIETLSVLSYAMAAFKKNEERSSEAGLKYVLYGGISSGLMLFGLSHIFGMLGTIQFSGIAPKLQELDAYQLAVLAPSFLFFFAGLGYKIACVPFHMWSPDVYEGSPIPVTTFFSIVPKLAGMAALTRVTMIFFEQEGVLQVGWIGVLSVAAALTMTVGNVSAIGQRSVKRMLAYSSISHAGMMMMGIVAVNQIGVRAIVFYGVTYLFMTLVAFYITSFVSDEYGNDHFERFNGMIKRYPFMAIMMITVMLSLAGIPPLSGFVAKFNIFTALLSEQFYTLAVIAALNSVVSLYYYLKIVRLMVFKDAETNESIVGFGFANQTIVVGLTVPVLIIGIFWAQIMHLASNAQLFVQ